MWFCGGDDVFCVDIFRGHISWICPLFLFWVYCKYGCRLGYSIFILYLWYIYHMLRVAGRWGIRKGEYGIGNKRNLGCFWGGYSGYSGTLRFSGFLSW